MEFIDLNLYGIWEIEGAQRNIDYYNKRLYEHHRNVSIYEETRIRIKMGGDKGVHCIKSSTSETELPSVDGIPNPFF